MLSSYNLISDENGKHLTFKTVSVKRRGDAPVPIFLNELLASNLSNLKNKKGFY